MRISLAYLYVVYSITGLSPLPEAEASDPVKVRGVGASFPNDVYQTWIPSYKASRQHVVELDMSYSADGSGEGIKQILENNRNIEYAGSDFPLTEEEMARSPDLVMMPTMAGGTVLAYNLRECSSSDSLNLTRHHVVGIYNGTYRYWNESTMQAINPNCKLPSHEILVIARSDDSGTTSMFTEALSSFSYEWNVTFGVFSAGVNRTTDSPQVWDSSIIHMLADGNFGMLGLVKSLRYSIGYMSTSTARDHSLSFAYIQNQHGEFTQPTKESVQAAMDSWATDSNLTRRLADGHLPGAYPIASYSYLIMYRTKMTQCDSAKELVRYVLWFLTTPSAQRDCEAKEMVPLSDKVAQRVQQEVLQTVRCQGRSTWNEMQADMEAENAAKKTWILPVAISLPIFAAIVLTLLGYIAWQRYKLVRMIENDEWDIPIEEIVFYEDRQGTSSGKSQMHSFRSLKSFVSINEIEDGDELLLQILQWPGKWKAHQVGVRLLEVSELRSVNRELKKCMLWLRDTVLHPNVVRFYGLTEVELDRYVIGEYCAKGSMVDILHSDKYNFNNDFKLSLSTDIASGMAFLHASGVVHGLLCSACCMIDARWTVKVGDWEFVKMLTAAVPTKRTLQLLRSKDDDNHANPLRDFWVAPELLRADFMADPTFASDVYSFSIILQEVYTREDPYAELADTMTSEEVIRAVCFNHLRPAPTDDTPVRVRQIMEIAWTENPAARPNFDQIVKMLRQSRSTRKSVLDSMMEAMEEYTLHLEERVAERSAEAGVAKHNLETLLADLVPRHLVSRLASGGSLQPQTYSSLGIVVTEIVGLSSALAHAPPKDVLAVLHDVCRHLEAVVKKRGAFQTVIRSDLHAALLGLEGEITFMDQRCAGVAGLAFEMVDAAFKAKPVRFETAETILSVRVGAHVGQVVTGVIGGTSPKFVFLGEGVEVAKALVTCSEPGRVRVSKNVFSHLEKNLDFVSEEAGWVICAGMEIESYWLKPRVTKTAISAPSDHSTDSGVSLENSRPDSRGSENGDADPTFAIFTEESESVTLQQTGRWASRERHASHSSQTKMSDHQVPPTHQRQQRLLSDISEEEEAHQPSVSSSHELQKPRKVEQLRRKFSSTLDHSPVLFTQQNLQRQRENNETQQQRQQQQQQQQQQREYNETQQQATSQQHVINISPRYKQPQEGRHLEPSARVSKENFQTQPASYQSSSEHDPAGAQSRGLPGHTLPDSSSPNSDYPVDHDSRVVQEHQFTSLRSSQDSTPAQFPDQSQHSARAFSPPLSSLPPPAPSPSSAASLDNDLRPDRSNENSSQHLVNSHQHEISFGQSSQLRDGSPPPEGEATSSHDRSVDAISPPHQLRHTPPRAAPPSFPKPITPFQTLSPLATSEEDSSLSNSTPGTSDNSDASVVNSSPSVKSVKKVSTPATAKATVRGLRSTGTTNRKRINKIYPR